MIPAYGETVTLHRATPDGIDDDGNDILTYSSVTVTDCAVWPRANRSAAEYDGDRATVIIGLTMLVPAGVTIRATDRVTVRGQLYEVDGEPGVWRSFLTGYQAGTEVALQRVEG